MTDLVPCPRCRVPSPLTDVRCAGCGMVFGGAPTAHGIPLPPPPVVEEPPVDIPWPRRIVDALTYVPPRVNTFNLAGRAIALVLLAAWGVRIARLGFSNGDVNNTFMHLVNLPFHEAGHVLFSPLGRFMTILGGSLFQVLVPLLCGGVFLVQQRNPVGAGACLWWAGESLVDLAPYIADARRLAMPLVGEWSDDAVEMRAERHDWHNILMQLGWLNRDQGLARGVHAFGTLVMVAACAWMAWLLARQWKRRSDVLLEEPDLQ
jgi:hypothetical protein